MKSIPSKEVIAENFAQATDFSQARAVLGICNCEIKEFERTIETALKLLSITFFFRFQCPPDLASYIC